MTGTSRLDLKQHYRSGVDDLARDFFGPCMRRAVSYDRAAGYFSTSALIAWIEGLPRVAAGELAIRLIASPILSEVDQAALASTVDPGERSRLQAVIVDRILDDIAQLALTPSDAARRARVFAWLVANERVRIRFAFPSHIDHAGIFHEKFGVLQMDDGELVAFTGSANETLGGHSRNYESIDVYRGGTPADAERVAIKLAQFEETWAGDASGLEVVAPSAAALARLRTASVGAGRTDEFATADNRWRHQDEAIEAFMAKPAGVLEMATGTGKTRTAIRIIGRLIDEGRVSTVIVTMEGVDLLEQWAGELQAWVAEEHPGWLVYRQFETKRESAEFVLDPERAILVVSRSRLAAVLPRLPEPRQKRSIIVHDEVHGLGAPALTASLGGQQSAFAFRLGLSATPERAYDEAGNKFIAQELGPSIYSFGLEKAIARGVLSEFDYTPLPYELTAGDRERIRLVYARNATRAREGNPMSQEELWTELSRVYKTAEMKVEVFAEHLRDRPDLLQRCIIFVETKEYGERILELVHKRTHRYRTYYADDDREHLVSFAEGGIDTLITCHRISQGIDIRSLRSVVLFASARSKLETIQRIGRCLRSDPTDPHKRALVVDFVRSRGDNDAVPNADEERHDWLSELSKIRRGDEIGN